MPLIDVPAVAKKDLYKRFGECAFVSCQGDVCGSLVAVPAMSLMSDPWVRR
jgi:hypothetical protein